MPINIPVTQTGLEASIEAAAKKAGKNLKINLGTSAKSIEGLSQPLGQNYWKGRSIYKIYGSC